MHSAGCQGSASKHKHVLLSRVEGLCQQSAISLPGDVAGQAAQPAAGTHPSHLLCVCCWLPAQPIPGRQLFLWVSQSTVSRRGASLQTPTSSTISFLLPHPSTVPANTHLWPTDTAQSDTKAEQNINSNRFTNVQGSEAKQRFQQQFLHYLWSVLPMNLTRVMWIVFPQLFMPTYTQGEEHKPI